MDQIAIFVNLAGLLLLWTRLILFTLGLAQSLLLWSLRHYWILISVLGLMRFCLILSFFWWLHRRHLVKPGTTGMSFDRACSKVLRTQLLHIGLGAGRTLVSMPEAFVMELDVIKQGQENLAYLSEAEILLAVRTLLHQDSGRFEPLKTVEAKERIALYTFVRICRYLVANYALEDTCADRDTFIAITA